MRYIELIKEDDSNPIDIAKSDILDLVVSLKAQKINSITMNQVIQNLQGDSRLSSIDIDQNFIDQAIGNIDGVEMMTNSAGVMCLNISDTSSPKPRNDNASKVDAMATNAAKKSLMSSKTFAFEDITNNSISSNNEKIINYDTNKYRKKDLISLLDSIVEHTQNIKNFGMSGDCGMYSLALGKILKKLGYSCELIFFIESGYDIETAKESIEKELDCYHVALEISGLPKGQLFDADGIVDISSIDNWIFKQYGDRAELIGENINSPDAIRLISNDTNWSRDEHFYTKIIDKIISDTQK